MPTGACGINCDVCRLKLLGICSTCGDGTSVEAEMKIETQTRLLGQACQILLCAHMNGVKYCMRDCRHFPCNNFSMGTYPFSQSFLDMQQRRRKQKPPARNPQGTAFTVPEKFWDDICQKDLQMLAAISLCRLHPEGGIIMPHLGKQILLDIKKRCIYKTEDNRKWEELDYPLLELMTLVYLLNVTDEPVQNDMISVSQLKDAHFFRGPHVLKTAPVMERFGSDLDGFKKAAQRLEGKPLNMADSAFAFFPFPKIPMYYLFWEGDDEFDPNLNILFDRSIEKHLSADAIWGVVNLVSDAILMES
jgi:hypothetical protein